MARHDSNSDLASLAATLTPRVSRAPAPPRASQNSGMFDVSALYAQAGAVSYPAPKGVARGAPTGRPVAVAPVAVAPVTAAFVAPVLRVARPSWPRVMGWPEPISYGDHEVRIVDIEEPPSSEVEIADVDFDFAPRVDLRRVVVPARPLGLGWYGVAVAWLATITLGGIMATSLPAHALPRARTVPAALALSVALPPAIAAAAPTLPPLAPAAVLTAPLGSTTGPVIPEINASLLPMAPRVAPAAPAYAPIEKGTPLVSKKDVSPHTTPPAQEHPHPQAGVPVAIAAPASPHATPAEAPAAQVVAAPPKAIAKPVSAGMSLDELIRHEVQAESAKHR
ncbi:MAG TPA: hypothetical protein VH044_12530 [Polyangiaceae bacterium]|nr:hypothetical protein [Polyangiaceae bacterium]